MKKIVIFTSLIVVSLYSAISDDSVARRLIGSYQDKRYELVVKQSDLDKAPAWAEEEQNPPLSVRAAIHAANAFVSRFVRNSEQWLVNRVTLERVGREKGQWIYVVEFTPYEYRKPILGPGSTFQVPVLLNGATIEPTVTEYQRKRDIVPKP